MKTAILAFSGGLDTSFCIPYLTSQSYEIITVTVNTGGFSNTELKEVEKLSKKLGAKKHYTINAKQELYDQFGSYIIKANYLRGGVYPACVGPERTVIASKIVEVAKKEKSTVIVHGSTGAGNDQVRFEVACKAFLPGCTVLAPVRDGGWLRVDELGFLHKHGHHISETKKDYSINVGLLGTTVGGKETHTAESELPEEVFPNVLPAQKTPTKPAEILIEFQKGLPTKLDGKKMGGVEIIQKLNTLVAEHGFGKDYHIGTTIVGLKARIGFEAPALKVLIKAHSELEKLVLTTKQLFWKNHLGTLYGDLVHEGLFCDPLIKNLEAFLDSASSHVSGSVTVHIHQGKLSIASLKSPYSLLNPELGTYGEKMNQWSGQDAKSFCQMYGIESINAFLTQQKKLS